MVVGFVQLLVFWMWFVLLLCFVELGCFSCSGCCLIVLLYSFCYF